MSLDKFGRSAARSSDIASSHLLSQYRRGLVFTADGNIDIEKLKLCNVQYPTEDDDATNKKYVDDNITSVKLKCTGQMSQLTSDLAEQKASLTTIEKSLEKLKTAVTAIDTSVASRNAIKVHANTSEVNLLK